MNKSRKMLTKSWIPCLWKSYCKNIPFLFIDLVLRHVQLKSHTIPPCYPTPPHMNVTRFSSFRSWCLSMRNDAIIFRQIIQFLNVGVLNFFLFNVNGFWKIKNLGNPHWGIGAEICLIFVHIISFRIVEESSDVWAGSAMQALKSPSRGQKLLYDFKVFFCPTQQTVNSVCRSTQVKKVTCHWNQKAHPHFIHSILNVGK